MVKLVNLVNFIGASLFIPHFIFLNSLESISRPGSCDSVRASRDTKVSYCPY